MPRTVLIIEPYATGHRVEHVRHILAALAGDRTLRFRLMMASFSLDHPSTRELLDDFGGQIELDSIVLDYGRARAFRPFGGYAHEQAVLATMVAERAAELVRAGDLSLAILPLMENIGLVQLAMRPHLFGGAPWLCVSQNLRFQLPGRVPGVARTWRDRLEALLLRSVLAQRDLAGFFTIMPLVDVATGSPKVTYVPDPAELPPALTRSAAREALGLDPNAIVLLVFGTIDRRKCLAEIVPAVLAAGSPTPVTLLLAGMQRPSEVAAVLAGPEAASLRAAGRLVEMNRFVSTAEANACFAAADLVSVYYEPEFVRSSGVLTRAAQAGKPVIARQVGLIAWYVERYRIGLLPRGTDALAKSIASLAGDPASRVAMGDRARAAFADFTPASFAAPIASCAKRVLAGTLSGCRR